MVVRSLQCGCWNPLELNSKCKKYGNDCENDNFLLYGQSKCELLAEKLIAEVGQKFPVRYFIKCAI